MVEHLVLLKLKDGTPEEAIGAIVDGLRALPDQIETIRELSCGLNFSERGQGFQIGLRVRFDDRAGLEVYGPHPAHQGVVAKLIRPHLEDIVASDFEA